MAKYNLNAYIYKVVVQQAQGVCAMAGKIVLTLKDRKATAHTQTVVGKALWVMKKA
ncbi:MAG: hypothetical protein ACK57K_02305 [Chryseotalea sp.]|jgi:hypothetical protein